MKIHILIFLLTAMSHDLRADQSKHLPGPDAVPSIADACNETGFEAAARSCHIDRNLIEKSSALDLMTLMDSGYNVTPWGLYTAPRFEARLAAYWFDLKDTQNFIRKMTGKETPTEEVLKAAAAGPATYSPESAARFKDYFISGMDDNYKTELRLFKKAAPGICLPYAVRGCSRALIRIIELQHPYYKDDHNQSLLPVMAEVFSDPSYVQGAAIAALRMNERVALAIVGTRTPGNLHDDLVNAYREAGLSDADSENHAYKVLAAYSTRGPVLDFAEKFSNSENHAMIVALHLISMSSGLVDALKSDGTVYSLPATVKSSCLYGKTYHFWLPAYLARALVKEGYGRRAAALAAHLAGMMYEAFSTTIGRTPKRPFEEPVFSTYSNSLRLNLAYNDAGAIYGAYPGHRARIDGAIEALFNDARKLRKSETRRVLEAGSRTSNAFMYFYWRKLFSPDSGYDTMLRD